MPIEILTSNSLKTLSSRLSVNLKNRPPSVFIPNTIVTQTEGMNLWLRQEFAQNMGIASNITFLKPNELVFSIYKILGGTFRETLNRQSLVWLIYKILGDKDFILRYPETSAYYIENNHSDNLKRLGLSGELADLYDQYQIYRPAMIQSWNMQTEASVDNWQAFVWKRAKKISDNSIPDKTQISQEIKRLLSDPNAKTRLQQKLPQIDIFGVSIFTQYHLEILQMVAPIIDVSFYILNPAPHIYWEEDNSEKQLARMRTYATQRLPAEAYQLVGNDLLINWGKVLKDTFHLLFDFNEDYFNAYTVLSEDRTEEKKPLSLLAKIQQDIYQNATDQRQILTEKDFSDYSISIHSNYSIAREVESLYNYFVYLIEEKNEPLSAREIVVLVSDINKYAPYIQAVFDNAPYSFPYRIADTALDQGDSIFLCLSAILHLNEDNFTSENVLQLLDSAYIRSRFGIQDIDILRQWVAAANIRFGMEGHAEDDSYKLSWSNGLRKIMYGIALSGSPVIEESGEMFRPLDIIEGNNSFQAVRFVQFVEILISSIKERKLKRTISDWVAYIIDVVHNLIYIPENDTDEDYITLQKLLTQLSVTQTFFSEKIDFTLFSYHLKSVLQENSRAGLFINEGVTFCSLIPMRSIPFKVVALLGMNSGAFPRRDKKVYYNLMNQKKEYGDRSIRDNDLHLFLETLLSAEKYLYISYIGNDTKDNAVLPPSIVVDELLSYITNGIKTDHLNADQLIDRLITRHALQRTSAKYNQNDKRYYNYLNTSPKKTQLLQSENNSPLILSTDTVTDISLAELLRFLKNPIKEYYNKALNLYYNDDNYSLDEEEVISPDPLQNWQLKLLLFQSDDTELQRQLIDGQFPLKNMGDFIIQKTASEIKNAQNDYAGLIQNRNARTSNFQLSFPHTPYTLSGVLEDIYDDRTVKTTLSKDPQSDQMLLYITVLIGLATEEIKEGFLLQVNSNKTYQIQMPTISPEEALARLEPIITLYLNGLKRPQIFGKPFFSPQSLLKTDLELNKIQQVVEQYVHNDFAPATNPYYVVAYNDGIFDSETIATDFNYMRRIIYQPATSMFQLFRNRP